MARATPIQSARFTASRPPRTTACVFRSVGDQSRIISSTATTPVGSRSAPRSRDSTSDVSPIAPPYAAYSSTRPRYVDSARRVRTAIAKRIAEFTRSPGRRNITYARTYDAGSNGPTIVGSSPGTSMASARPSGAPISTTAFTTRTPR